ncbi:DNA polymerase III subunit gamma and tau [Marmoricola endophyticus]|uniref:DNA polymerase III subunit gamma/tau n=1 Tax=Marmoricola endophyticus TaxID=2040280 RepID=A0A917BLT0_9ACTN|nr:DNA polymerase III subunit gamma and tau [Marmoricola endophyticus]
MQIVEPSLALYRRYRPETFAEVIGQDHVTEPLRAALAANRVNHAYLFSGPRGCGKTTSARILARALNCERAPVPDPCGECRSCRDLARGGPGSIDVIEMDAATHNGVDDARDLREKAYFAPVRDRYKVYIIDEAHMVTSAAFNALLKLVEEPPPHLKFIFATTEPEKVLPTIRSRTHHYPFRLIPPRTLSAYLATLCEQEGVRIDAAALPLVVRSGAGSARDTLSVLDQLLGGAGPDGVTTELATGLLGYTPDNLLDEVVDAFAAADGGTVFGVVDKVIEAGQDPRRFTEDLLRRLRDLVVVAQVPEAASSGLIDGPEDSTQRLVDQAARFGAAELVRAADLVAAGLTEMRGATAPRLLLELICARVLLPGADHGSEGLAARLDRLERRVSPGGMPAPSGAAAARAAMEPARAAEPPPVVAAQGPAGTPAAEPDPAPILADEAPEEDGPDPRPWGEGRPEPERRPDVERPPAADREPRAAEADPGPQSPEVESVETSSSHPTEPDRGPRPTAVEPVETSSPPADPSPPPPEVEPAETTTVAAPGLTLADVRRIWPALLDRVAEARRFTWILLSQNAQVVGVEGTTLTLGFRSAGAHDRFFDGGNDELLRQALIDEVGADWKVEGVTDPSVQPGAEPAPVVTRPSVGDREPPADPTQPSTAAPRPVPTSAPPASPAAEQARAGIQPTRRPDGDRPAPGEREDDGPADSDWDPSDPAADDSSVSGAELLARELGATVIEEIPHE